MHVFLLGVSHHTAPVELRERLDVGQQNIRPALDRAASLEGIGEVVLLSTCNRSELYVTCDEPARAADALEAYMSETHDVPLPFLRPHVYRYSDADAARHLFRVAGGLDSMVVGEPQILGQVKDAYSAASERQYTGPLLNKLFHWSFAVGKRVRAETGLGEGAVSVGYAAVSLARKIFGDLPGLRVLLLGAGEMAKLTAVHLRSQKVGAIVVASRTAGHAEALAAQIGGKAIRWNGLGGAIAESDIVITATGSPKPILSRHEIAAAIQARRNQPLFIIDIAVPRDVDPAAAEIEQVFLYNIDDLQAIVTENVARRTSEFTRADDIVAEEVERFACWLRSREAIPTLVALRERFDTIRRAELKRLEYKLGALPPEARARVEEITRLIVEKLLLSPTEQLKALSDRDTMTAYSTALNQLFNLTDGAAAAAALGGESEDAAPAPPVANLRARPRAAKAR